MFSRYGLTDQSVGTNDGHVCVGGTTCGTNCETVTNVFSGLRNFARELTNSEGIMNENNV